MLAILLDIYLTCMILTPFLSIHVVYNECFDEINKGRPFNIWHEMGYGFISGIVYSPIWPYHWYRLFRISC